MKGVQPCPQRVVIAMGGWYIHFHGRGCVWGCEVAGYECNPGLYRDEQLGGVHYGSLMCEGASRRLLGRYRHCRQMGLIMNLSHPRHTTQQPHALTQHL